MEMTLAKIAIVCGIVCCVCCTISTIVNLYLIVSKRNGGIPRYGISGNNHPIEEGEDLRVGYGHTGNRVGRHGDLQRWARADYLGLAGRKRETDGV